jgi:hypothetical protein
MSVETSCVSVHVGDLFFNNGLEPINLQKRQSGGECHWTLTNGCTPIGNKECCTEQRYETPLMGDLNFPFKIEWMAHKVATNYGLKVKFSEKCAANIQSLVKSLSTIFSHPPRACVLRPLT